MKNKKEMVTYQNEFVDKFVLDYKQKELDLFFAIIFQMQKNSKIIEFQKENIKKSIKNVYPHKYRYTLKNILFL